MKTQVDGPEAMASVSVLNTDLRLEKLSKAINEEYKGELKAEVIDGQMKVKVIDEGVILHK